MHSRIELQFYYWNILKFMIVDLILQERRKLISENNNTMSMWAA